MGRSSAPAGKSIHDGRGAQRALDPIHPVLLSVPFPPLALSQHLEDRHDIGVGVEKDGAQVGVRALPGQDQHHTALAHLWEEGGMSPGSRMGTQSLDQQAGTKKHQLGKSFWMPPASPFSSRPV